MANVVSKKAKKQMLDALLALGTLTAYLLKSSYTYSAAHQYVADLGANIRATVACGGVTTGVPNDGTVDCNDQTWSAVNGDFSGVWYAVNTGNAATSPLLFFSDVIAGFPGSITNGDVLATVDNGSDRLFTL
jgi:hypothetical protein